MNAKQAIEILTACVPLAQKLASVAGIYTELTAEEEALLENYGKVTEYVASLEYQEAAWDELRRAAKMLSSDLGLVDGRWRQLLISRDPEGYKAEVKAILRKKGWLK
jgi:hypothetical protein